jgi:ATP-dependent protease ClpP protease subunit
MNIPSLLPRNRAPQLKPDSWWSVRNQSESEKTLYLYGIVGGGWFEEGATADNVVSEIRDFTGSTLNVRVNSPGGLVFEGIAIANALRAHPAKVNIYVDGLAASIASVIAVSGDSTVMMPNSQMMIHEASGGCLGNAEDMRKTAGMLDSISENIAGAYADRTRGDVGTWRAMMKAETWYNAAEAVAAGLADEVSEARPPEDPTATARFDVDQLRAQGFRFGSREQAPAPIIEPRNSTDQTREPDPVEPPATPSENHSGVDINAFLSALREVTL